MKEIERFARVQLQFTETEAPVLETTHDVAEAFARYGLHDSVQEQLWVMTLDGERHIRTIVPVAMGGYHDCDVSVPAILSPVFLGGTDRFLIAHNHPSDALEPTDFDLDLTDTLSEAADLLDLVFEDHLIVTPSGRWYSFRGHGEMRRRRSRKVRE